MIFLAVGLAAVAVIVALMSSALVEVYRQLAELRRSLQLEDVPRPLALRPGEIDASALTLPARLANEPEAIAVFLTPSCATCLMIADTFRGGSPATVWFVIPETGASL